MLRSWPVDGAAVVAASALSSALALTVVHLLAGSAAFAAAAPSLVAELGSGRVLAAVATVFIALPVLNLLAALVHNGAALLFPAWVHLGPERPGGLEAMGQLYLTLFATLALLSILLLLPAGVAFGIARLTTAALGPWSWPLAAAAAAPVALLEGGMLAQWLGDVFERTEPSAVGAA